MGDYWSLETPLWFAPKGVKDEFSFHRSTDFAHVAAECRAVRSGVGISETSSFAKYAIDRRRCGGLAVALLANKMPREGRMTLSPMLNHKGKLIGDFTVAKAGPETFYVFGSGAAEKYHMRWFERALCLTGRHASRSSCALGQSLVGLTIAGPRAARRAGQAHRRRRLGRRVQVHGFPPDMEIGMVPCMVGRVSYTGDLGYELWCAPEYHVALFDALMGAGAELGIKPFGSRALLSLAREKLFGTWAREFRPIYGPFEAGLGRFVDLSKNDFVGRAAAAEEKANGGGKLQRVAFTVEAADADAIGDEAVWNNGKVVGWITSGGYCHHAGVSLAQGYVPRSDLTGADTATWEIEIIGEKRPARLQAAALFDAAGTRMRG